MSTFCHRPTHTSVIHTFDCFYIPFFFWCFLHVILTYRLEMFQRVYATICAAPLPWKKFIIHFSPPSIPDKHIYIITIPRQHDIHIPQQELQYPSSLLSTRHPTPFTIPPLPTTMRFSYTAFIHYPSQHHHHQSSLHNIVASYL